jgi:two-component system chemotaxis response regulator CheY
MRALVVDDSRAMRAILRDALTASGFQVVEARHAKDALEALRELGPIELGLVDWNLPGASGLELAREIRANRDFDAMRLVMVTTELETEQVLLALDAGVDEYLMKPFTREMLTEKLALLGLAGDVR